MNTRCCRISRSSWITSIHIRHGFILALMVITTTQYCTAQSRSPIFLAPSPFIPQTTQWGLPGHSDPVKILYIAPHATMDEVGQLEARFSFSISPVALWDTAHLGHTSTEASHPYPQLHVDVVSEQLQAALKKTYQVIVLAQLSPDILPDWATDQILDQVRQGTGLLLAHSTPMQNGTWQKRLQDSSPFDLPETLQESSGWNLQTLDYTLGTLGNGRVAQCASSKAWPVQHGLVPPPDTAIPNALEYYTQAYSFFGKLLRFLGRGTPDLTLTHLEVAGDSGPLLDEIPPWFPQEYVQTLRDSESDMHTRTLRIQWSQATSKEHRLKIRLRREGDPQPLYVLEERSIRGRRSAEMPLVIGPGFYLVDAWLMDKDGVVDWFTQSLRIDGWPAITKLDYQAKQGLRANDVLELRCTVQGSSRQTQGCTLYGRAIDSFGRVVTESYVSLPPEGGDALLRLNFADLIAPMLRIDVAVTSGQVEHMAPLLLARGYSESFFIPVQHEQFLPDLKMLFSTATHLELNGLDQYKRLKEMGYTHIVAPAGPENFLLANAAQLSLIPEVATIQAEAAVDGTLRQPCLSNPSYKNNLVEQVRNNTRQHLTGTEGLFVLGSPAYLCASEEPICQSPHCQEDYLERERAWPLPLPDDATFQRWQMNQVFAQTHSVLATTVAQTSPAAKSGFQTTVHPKAQHGYDWYTLANQLDFLAIPADPYIENRVQSYAPVPTAYFLQPTERSYSPDDATYFAWYTLLHRYSGIWQNIDQITNDKLAAAQQMLPAGLGPLLRAATPIPPEIMIFESTLNQAWRGTNSERNRGALDSERELGLRLKHLNYAFGYLHGNALGTALVSTVPKVIIIPKDTLVREPEILLLKKLHEKGSRIVIEGTPKTLTLEDTVDAISMLDWAELHAPEGLSNTQQLQGLIQESGIATIIPEAQSENH